MYVHLVMYIQWTKNYYSMYCTCALLCTIKENYIVASDYWKATDGMQYDRLLSYLIT